MTVALLAMSHSPLLEHAELDEEVSGELETAFAEAERIASLIPRATLAVMDNCGHWPQYEDTETFNKIHLDFLLDR